MYVLDVVPLTKIPLPSSQVLTYFSKKRAKEGSLVLVPMAGRKVKAIALSASNIEEKKLEIKRKSFKLKKIEKILYPTPLISESQMELALWLHKFYLNPLGPVFKLFLPRILTERKKTIKKIVDYKSQTITHKSRKSLLFWGENRINFYLKEKERVLKEGKQVLFLVPEVQDANKIYQEIIQSDTFFTTLKNVFGKENKKISLLHSNLKSSTELREWKKIRNGETKVIVGTRSAVFAPFRNLGLIIIEKEENPAFKSWQQYPRYDAKEVALKLGKITGAELILGSSFPSVESYYKAKKGKYELKKYKMRNIKCKTHIVDMRDEIRKGNYSIFSEKLENELKKILDQKKKAILFCNRRGAATYIFCQDCGWAARCKDCNVPLVYHRKVKGTSHTKTESPVRDQKSKVEEFLLCHHCGKKTKAPIICPKCRGHRIKYSGIGTQKVVQELKNFFPKIKIFRLDSDIAPKTKTQKLIFEKFLKSKNSILVGTQIFLKFSDKLSQHLSALVSIVSADQFLNIPDFKAGERAFRFLNKLRNFGQKIIIQTYNPKVPALQFFKEKNAKEFLQKEIKSRRQFSYPPFSEIIKLAFRHRNAQKAQKAAANLRKRLEKLFKVQGLKPKVQILGPTSGFIPKIKGKYVQNIFLKIKNQKSKIKNVLFKNFPKSWQADVNPHSLL